ncbi:MAG TPA: type II toxin-antitoxin system VapB family antitoxin [Polyangiaceae bacterium]|nr:type II toxin-antitoxin system VapB family antitoxin [Polyangiaceae bacterium]
MATNLAIDESLLTEALRVGGLKTKKATVTQALQEYVQRRRQVKIIDLFGSVEIRKGYDYKKQRNRVSGGWSSGVEHGFLDLRSVLTSRSGDIHCGQALRPLREGAARQALARGALRIAHITQDAISGRVQCSVRLHVI